MIFLNQLKINTTYFPKDNFNYKFILEQLNICYDGFQNENKKNEVSKYIELWKLSGETYNNKNINKTNKETTKQLKLENLLKELGIKI
jgi:hypothetical protein